MTKKNHLLLFKHLRDFFYAIINFFKIHSQSVNERIKRHCSKAEDSIIQANAINEKGYALLKQGNLTDAENLFRSALKINPTLHQAKSNLGQVLRLAGKLTESEIILRDAVNTKPNDALIYNRLGTTLRELGKDSEAEFYYREGLAINPNDADIMNNLGGILNNAGKLLEAAHYFQGAVNVEPSHVIAKCNLCVNLSDRGLHEEADQCFLEAINLDPNYYFARISHVMNKLPIINTDSISLNESRTQYENALIELRNWLSAQNTTLLDSAADSVGWISPFYLTYQGQNNKKLQSIYGTLICNLMAHRYPEFSAPPSMPPITAHTPLRIGIVSAFFYDHSNWKTPIRGWLEHIDQSRFTLFGYYTGTEQDKATEQAKQLCHQFIEGLTFEAFADQIKKDALHVLIFPEISMDPVTTKLATLRLAPIQCNSWGHPDTSGMPTIDYYLSSEIMEPEDGQSHYTETLITLPNLSIAYTPPNYNVLPLTREYFNLRNDKILYCCAQSLFKYLPQFDYLLPRIATSIPNAQFVFFGNQKSKEVDEIFIRRISAAFQKEGLDPSNHIVMLSRLGRNEFQTVLNLCDIYLDSIEWSGCNTTLEAFLCDIAVITYKGSMMRGRHTYAFLKMMGLNEAIANNLEEYAELAIELGSNLSKRQQIKDGIKRNFYRICGDTSSVRGLEHFLLNAVNTYNKV